MSLNVVFCAKVSHNLCLTRNQFRIEGKICKLFDTQMPLATFGRGRHLFLLKHVYIILYINNYIIYKYIKWCLFSLPLHSSSHCTGLLGPHTGARTGEGGPGGQLLVHGARMGAARKIHMDPPLLYGWMQCMSGGGQGQGPRLSNPQQLVLAIGTNKCHFSGGEGT